MTHYEIFHRCFPQLSVTEKQFSELSEIKDCTAIDYADGFALVKENAVRLLCVLPDKRGQGTGSRLLEKAEGLIREKGYSRAEIGGTDSGLFIGAVSDSASFFEKHGYTFGENIAEMCGDAGQLQLTGKLPEGVSFGFADGGSERLREAVAAVDEDWVQYFGGGEIFCGFVGADIASFCIVEDDVTCVFSDAESRVGSIGCVGTVPQFRKRGIGLSMVSLASQELLKRGCNRIFIHYTGVYDWYARLGYKTQLWVRLGGKELY